MLKDLIIKNGGATINKKGAMVTLKSGYQVSKKDILKIAVDKFNEQIINNIIHNNLKRGEYAGFWVEDGYVYADISERISTKHEALAIGKQRKQISILNWRNMGIVYC